MSVIERCARAAQLSKMRNIAPEDQEAWLNKTWEQSVPDVLAVLQCLSDNIDEGGLSRAATAFCDAENNDKNITTHQAMIPAIAAYLNTISKDNQV